MELLEEAFHTEDLEEAAFLVAVEEVTPVEDQADMAFLVARQEAHREVRPDRQTTPQTLTGSGVAPTMATGADNLRPPWTWNNQSIYELRMEKNIQIRPWPEP